MSIGNGVGRVPNASGAGPWPDIGAHHRRPRAVLVCLGSIYPPSRHWPSGTQPLGGTNDRYHSASADTHSPRTQRLFIYTYKRARARACVSPFGPREFKLVQDSSSLSRRTVIRYLGCVFHTAHNRKESRKKKDERPLTTVTSINTTPPLFATQFLCWSLAQLVGFKLLLHSSAIVHNIEV